MARERYLLEVEGEELKREEKRELTPKEKRKNFWYYNKGKFAVGAFVLLLVSYLIYSIVSRVNPDYNIALMTTSGYNDPTVEQIEEQFAKYGEDLNGDGKVIVNIIPYTGSSDTTGTTAMIDTAKIVTDFDACMSIIFVCDAASLENLIPSVGSSFFVDMNTMEMAPDNLNDLTPIRVLYKDWKGFEGFQLEDRYYGMDSATYTENMMGRLRISMRTLTDTNYEDNENKIEYFEGCRRLVEKVLNGE